MITYNPTKQSICEQCDDYIHVCFSTPHRVLSSAVLNGGLADAEHILNLKVPKHSQVSEPPAATLAGFCHERNWHGVAVGMMTAASMKSFRMSTTRIQGVDVAVLVTTGLSNPRRAGDRAEHRTIAARHDQPGTINIVALTSAALTDAAMVEALLTVTEAKAAALQEVGVLSPVSGQLATGTGTDSVAVVSGTGPQTIAYCGKHVLFGETLAALAIEAVTDSIAWYRSNITEIAVAAP